MEDIEITAEDTDMATIMKLRGRLDSVTAVGLKDRVKDFAAAGKIRLVIDMAEVDFVDSSGLGSLVACLRSVNKAGGDIRIAALRDRVRAVFELIRLHQIFEIFDSAAIAAASFRDAGKVGKT